MQFRPLYGIRNKNTSNQAMQVQNQVHDHNRRNSPKPNCAKVKEPEQTLLILVL